MSTNFSNLSKNVETLAAFMDEVIKHCTTKKAFSDDYEGDVQRCHSCPFCEGCGNFGKAVEWLNKEIPLTLKDAKPGSYIKKNGCSFLVLDHSKETTALMDVCPLYCWWSDLPYYSNYLDSGMRAVLLKDRFPSYCEIFGKKSLVRHTVDLTALDGSSDELNGKKRNCHDYASVFSLSKYIKYKSLVDKAIDDSSLILSTISTYNHNSNNCKQLMVDIANKGAIDMGISFVGGRYKAPVFLVVMSDVEVDEIHENIITK